MRLNNFLVSSWVAVTLVLGSGVAGNDGIIPRQDKSASGFPTLGSGNTQSVSATITASPSNSNTQSGSSASNTGSASVSASGSPPVSVSVTHSGNSTSSAAPTSSSALAPTSTPSAVVNGTAAADADDNALPLPPHITPALSIGGVVLILTGLVYTLIGVKNRWIHIFLSTAYLTSLSITVLIVYVLNPPVSNAIQGAYFVGIFMTGVIFGSGALIFKEVTEGLGCLLGGFSVSMWFLTLKEGGLMTSTSGKAIFITAFCVVAWSLSFSHYTRAYGLMGSIAFSGSTAFVLGIDCFSRGGLKEFWLYIWDLNDNIFPLNTNTYPISRGTRVESIVIILGTIIGVISQMKLWKIVKDRQTKKEEAHAEDQRRQEVVEAALGRHLERQNDRDRSQWEKQYGDRLTAKRETILWTEAHGEKGYSKIRETEIHHNRHSSSPENMEMTNMARKSRSMYVTRVKRHSVPVNSIPEVEEAESAGHKSRVRQKVLDQLEGNRTSEHLSPESNHDITPAASPQLDNDTGLDVEANADAPFVDGTSRKRNSMMSDGKSIAVESHREIEGKRSSDLEKYLSAPEDDKQKKRRSFTSFLSRSKENSKANTPSQSQEALVIPETALRHSRASSLAATLDFENENLEFPSVDVDIANPQKTPEIVVSPVEQSSKSQNYHTQTTIREVAPSEPELAEENLDLDPEEFVRPTAVEGEQRNPSGPSLASKRQSSSETVSDGLFEDATKSRTATTETSQAEILTKGALDQMPSQLSHVVMSYRTNEWAKHISTADAPLFEEPEVVEEEHELEPPTHLADPVSPMESKRSSLNHPLPPQVAVPVPSAIPSPVEGIRINPVMQPEQPTMSAVVMPAQPAQAAQPNRVRSTSESSKVPRGFRSTSTPMLVKKTSQSFATIPIDENAAATFSTRHQNMRSASAHALNQPSLSHSPQVSRSNSAMNNYPTVHRSNSRLSMVSENGNVPIRPNSQMSNYNNHQSGPYQHSPYVQGQNQHLPTRSETRLQSYDSHQPLRRNTSFENQRREAMLADWRVAQHKTPVQSDHTELHRQQMLMERQQSRMMEEHEKNNKYQQEIAVDARMRSRDMQDLHREAMRKLQASANKKMTQ